MGISDTSSIKRMRKDLVLVSELREERMTPGGIAIPATASTTDRDMRTGRVEAVGRDAQDLNVGDLVLFDRHNPKLTIDGREYRAVPESEIAAVVEFAGE